MPAAVSTCGANTTAGCSARMAATTSSSGAGLHAACGPSPSGRAAQTVTLDAMEPASRIWDQRYEKSPLRTTKACAPVAKCRATDSMA